MNTEGEARRVKPADLFLLFINGVGITSVYWDVVPGMVRDWWDDPNFSHGFLVPLFSTFLIWERRHSIKLFPERSAALPGIALLVTALVLLVLGKAGGEFFTMRFSLILVVASFCCLLAGYQGIKTCFFPIAFLVFMIPIPYILYDAIAFPLKLIASRVGELSLETLGVPVFREGNIIHLAALQLEVVDACSGIRSLFSLLAIATVIAHLFRIGISRGAILLLSAVPFSVFTNSLRITMTGIIANSYGPETAKGFFHDISGGLIFLMGVAALLFFGMVLAKTRVRRTEISEGHSS